MALKYHKKSYDIISCSSTEGDSAEEEREEEISKTNPIKHKT
jgi:hypothetical protein